MQEVLPGVHHWTAYRETIGMPVSSYWIEPAGVVIDPMVPEAGLDTLRRSASLPREVVLTTGLHARQSADVAAAFAIPIRAPREARERLGDTLAFEPYDDGEAIAPGVEAVHIGVLCPDEYALYLEEVDGGAIAIADAAHIDDDAPQFFSDELLGDDPQAVKAGLRAQLAALLERDFQHLLFAHGGPLLRTGRRELERFVGRG